MEEYSTAVRLLVNILRHISTHFTLKNYKTSSCLPPVIGWWAYSTKPWIVKLGLPIWYIVKIRRGDMIYLLCSTPPTTMITIIDIWRLSDPIFHASIWILLGGRICKDISMLIFYPQRKPASVSCSKLWWRRWKISMVCYNCKTYHQIWSFRNTKVSPWPNDQKGMLWWWYQQNKPWIGSKNASKGFPTQRAW